MTSIATAPDMVAVAQIAPDTAETPPVRFPTGEIGPGAPVGFMGRVADFQHTLASKLQGMGASVAGSTGSTWAVPLVIIVVLVAVVLVARSSKGKGFFKSSNSSDKF